MPIPNIDYAPYVPSAKWYVGVISWPSVGPALSAPIGVAITPDGTRAYVADNGINGVWVINTSTYAVTGPISVDDSPGWITLSNDGSKAYVGNVSVISTSTNLVTTTIAVGSPSQGGGAVIAGGTEYIYIPGDGGGETVVEATDTLRTPTVAAPGSGVGVCFVGNTGYVASPGGTDNDYVYVFDATTGVFTAYVYIYGPTGFSDPTGITPTPDGSSVWVANSGTNFLPHNGKIMVVDTVTNLITTTIPASSDVGLFDVVITPDGSTAYATGPYSGGFLGGAVVDVFDVATETLTTSIAVGTSPFGLAVTPDGSKVFVCNRDSGTVSVIDTGTNTVIATIS